MFKLKLRDQALLLGSEANLRAESGDYYSAIELYSKAIELCPYDYRFYLNRAFCYEKTELYHLALLDSETSIRLNQSIEKCYIRKARALAGLRKYLEAEQTYELLLKMNPNLAEAKEDLIELRFRALKAMGFDRQTAVKASTAYDSIRSAIDGLLSQSIKIFDDNSDESFDDSKAIEFISKYSQWSDTSSVDMPSNVTNSKSDDKVLKEKSNNSLNKNICEVTQIKVESTATQTGSRYADKVSDWAKSQTSTSAHNTIKPKPKILRTNSENSDPKERPTNIWGYNGIRVEKVIVENKKAIIEVFSAFGKVKGVEPMPHRKHSMLVFYDNPSSPINAIAALQFSVHREISHYSNGTAEPLRLYFAATDDQPLLKYNRPKHPKNSFDECYYWRTTTCIKNKCRLRHIPVNQYIDAQVWMKDPEGKPI